MNVTVFSLHPSHAVFVYNFKEVLGYFYFLQVLVVDIKKSLAITDKSLDCNITNMKLKFGIVHRYDCQLPCEMSVNYYTFSFALAKIRSSATAEKQRVSCAHIPRPAS